MSFNSLPIELKRLIVEHVAAQDRWYTAERRRKRSIPLGKPLEFEPPEKPEPEAVFFEGVKAMSRVNWELYEVCLPLLFEVQPLRLDLMTHAAHKELPFLELGQHCRTIRLGPIPEEHDRGSQLLFLFNLLDGLPRVDCVELYLGDPAFEDLRSLISVFPGSARAVLPGSFEDGHFSFSSHRSDPNVQNLQSLEVYLENQARFGAATVHPTWLQEPFLFIPTLSSICFTVQTRTDVTIIQFLARFEALKTISLTCRGLPSPFSAADSRPFPFPALRSLALHLPNLTRLIAILPLFSTPALTSLTVGVTEASTSAVPAFIQAAEDKLQLPSFRRLSIVADADYIPSAASISYLRTALAAYDVELRTSWSPMRRGNQLSEDAQELVEAEKLLAWAGRRLEQMKMGEESKEERRLLLSGLRGLADLREVLEK
ncbi:hypothetical protein JCM6882_006043 [Rhodosporidiobolus microsporus]